jgi:hypothetical protein
MFKIGHVFQDLKSSNLQSENPNSSSASHGSNRDKPDRIVRIAYFDHAGCSKIEEEPIAATAAVLVHGDAQWRWIEQRRASILADPQWGLSEQQQREFEFHAYKLFSGGYSPFERWGKDKRHALLSAFLEILPKFNLPICAGVLDRAGFREAAPFGVPADISEFLVQEQQKACFECAYAVNSWLRHETQVEVAMCIFDRADEPVVKAIKHSIRTHRHFSAQMQGLVWFEYLIDTPYFADPIESFGLELADACAFLLKRHLVEHPSIDTEKLYSIIDPQIVCPPRGIEFCADPWRGLRKDTWPL